MPTHLGIDIGGTSTKAALHTGDPASATTAQSAPYTDPTPATIRDAITTCLDQLNPNAITTLGLCLPGRLSSDQSTIERALNLPTLEGTRIADLLPAFPNPSITPDTIAHALGVHATHPEPGRLFCLCIGTGVGAAVLDNGRPLRVTGQAIGHFGQIDIGPIPPHPDATSPDGAINTLEAHLGGRALLNRLNSPPDEAEAAIRDLPSDDPARIALARALRTALALYRPNTLALAGGVAKALAANHDLQAHVIQGLTAVIPPTWRLNIAPDTFTAARGASLAHLHMPATLNAPHDLT
jgi:predicted NBD/HSP70 family sugar kinase